MSDVCQEGQTAVEKNIQTLHQVIKELSTEKVRELNLERVNLLLMRRSSVLLLLSYR